MLKKNKPLESIVELFARQSCWMIKPLANKIQYSIPSVRRFLAAVGYFSSFTHNGKWYTLHSIPQFDHDGLWFSDDIGFSRSGSLTKTLVALVVDSPSGASAEELGRKLRCRCHSVLVGLCRKGKLQREKHIQSYIYLAADSHIADTQRQLLQIENPPLSQLPAEIAVLILVEFIRDPGLSFTRLAGLIKQNRGIIVSTGQVKQLFEQYGLKKTKIKTAPKHGLR